VLLVSCSTHDALGPTEVSATPALPSAAAGFIASNAVGSPSAVYVSALPGTYGSALTATVGRSGASDVVRESVRVDLVGGGFDPVRLPAAAGDNLIISIESASHSVAKSSTKVPARTAPTIVRISCATGTIDFPVNAQLLVVFSEPIDPSTVTPKTFALRQGNTLIPGSIKISGDGLVAEFIPSRALQPSVTYSLDVLAGITDLQHDQLAASITATFQTGPPLVTGTLRVTTHTVASPADGHIPQSFQLNVDDSVLATLGSNETIDIPGIVPGAHIVALVGVPNNCSAGLGLSRGAIVGSAFVTPVGFDIVCEAGSNLSGSMAFVSERDGNSEIYSMNLDGSDLKRLTNNPDNDTEPAWSPDGKRIAFVREHGYESSVYVMNADGSNVVLRSTDRFSTSPAWSPDGKKIAYAGLVNGQYAILITDVDGVWDSPVAVGHPTGWNAEPAWTPDGKRISFTSDYYAYDFVYDMWIMDADGSNIAPLLVGNLFYPNERYYYQGAWSPDGKKIATVVCTYAWDNCYPESQVAIANADGTGLRVLKQSSGFSHPSWSPDGATLLYSNKYCRDCTGEIRYVGVNDSREGIVISNAHSPAWRPQPSAYCSVALRLGQLCEEARR
jgi:Tol biopolymer transport system component